ncbi:hypothetical protein PSEUDO8AS_10186 [Pseudomonas sp. 8AS]|nr:hypothetical protein PSEUDO8AS_10186 [Pseudomonas sp. 8AS]
MEEQQRDLPGPGRRGRNRRRAEEHDGRLRRHHHPDRHHRHRVQPGLGDHRRGHGLQRAGDGRRHRRRRAGDDGRRRHHQRLHRQAPVAEDAGAVVPHRGRHRADRRSLRDPCAEGLRLLRHGLLPGGRGDQHPHAHRPRTQGRAGQAAQGYSGAVSRNFVNKNGAARPRFFAHGPANYVPPCRTSGFNRERCGPLLTAKGPSTSPATRAWSCWLLPTFPNDPAARLVKRLISRKFDVFLLAPLKCHYGCDEIPRHRNKPRMAVLASGMNLIDTPLFAVALKLCRQHQEQVF